MAFRLKKALGLVVDIYTILKDDSLERMKTQHQPEAECRGNTTFSDVAEYIKVLVECGQVASVADILENTSYVYLDRKEHEVKMKYIRYRCQNCYTLLVDMKPVAAKYVPTDREKSRDPFPVWESGEHEQFLCKCGTINNWYSLMRVEEHFDSARN